MKPLGMLLGVTLALWLLVLLFYGGEPVLLGAAVLAYALGLRHAVDADHIAAIDNVTRKLAREGTPSATTGLFFSAGHSSVVGLAAAAAAFLPSFGERLDALHDGLGQTGALISSLFLLYIAAANALSLRHAAAGRPQGPLARLATPLFGLVRRGWQMYPLGLLFGLGFDTASEIALLALTARAATGMTPVAALLLPALFAAAMALVDTADSVLSARAYGWSGAGARRRYDLIVTGISIVAACVVALLQLLALAGRDVASLAPDVPQAGGALLILAVLASWAVARLLHRHRAQRRAAP
jgi:high-affinity nickel-transport protein